MNNGGREESGTKVRRTRENRWKEDKIAGEALINSFSFCVDSTSFGALPRGERSG